MSKYKNKSRKSLEDSQQSKKSHSIYEDISDDSRSTIRSNVSHSSSHSRKSSIHRNPYPNKILAIFGLDLDTKEADLHKVYSHFGCVKCRVIMDKETKRSRGYGFVYFQRTNEAIKAKKATEDKKIRTKRIRIDYSMETRKKNYDRPRSPRKSEFKSRDKNEASNRKKKLYEKYSSAKYESYRNESDFERCSEAYHENMFIQSRHS